MSKEIDYELEGEDCSKFHEEIVRIMKYDPIEKIKTSMLMSRKTKKNTFR